MDLLLLKPGTPRALVYLAYYMLLIISGIFSLWLIFAGLSDPFGSLLVVAGGIALILGPVLLRLIFGLLLKESNKIQSERLSR